MGDLGRWGRDYRGWSKSTREQYVRRVARAECWFQANLDKPLQRATPKELELYFFGPDVKPTLSNRSVIRTALVAYFDFLGRKNNPAKSLPNIRRKRSIPRALSPQAVEIILERLPYIDLESQAAIGLWLWAGLRFSEANFLQWAEIEYPYLRFRGKGDKERLVPVHTQLRASLESWRLECPCPQWVFPSPIWPGRPISHSCLRGRVKAALEANQPHALRHTFATSSIECEAFNVFELQEVMGHSDLRTTRRYYKVRPQRLADGISKLHY